MNQLSYHFFLRILYLEKNILQMYLFSQSFPLNINPS